MLKDSSQIKKICGKRLEQLINEKGITQTKLASDTNLALTTVSNYKNSVKLPQGENLYKICRYFNVPTDYLLGLTDIRETAESFLKKQKTEEEEKQKIINELYDILLEENPDNLKIYKEIILILRNRNKIEPERDYKKIKEFVRLYYRNKDKYTYRSTINDLLKLLEIIFDFQEDDYYKNN